MTDQTFTMTMAQIKAVFDAGSRSGESAACSYNCGSSYNGANSDFVEAVHDVVNKGKTWGDGVYMDWAAVEAMVKAG